MIFMKCRVPLDPDQVYGAFQSASGAPPGPGSAWCSGKHSGMIEQNTICAILVKCNEIYQHVFRLEMGFENYDPSETPNQMLYTSLTL